VPKATVNKNEPQKTDYFVLLLLLAGLIFLYYNVFQKDKGLSSSDNEVELAPYSIINTDLNLKRGFRVSVRIYEKLPNLDLIDIAKRVKSDINAISDRGMVFFLLPEMLDKNGGWAAVDFNPEIRVRIIGKSIEDEYKIRSGLENVTNYVGLWMDNGMPGDVIIRIRKDKVEGNVFEYVSPTDPKPSELAIPLKRIQKGGKTIFIDNENTEQFFVVEENGDLLAYDNYGFICRYVKLK
jgi:hypothetical protein